MYQIQKSTIQELIRWEGDDVVKWIPTDPANTDYQAYLEWVAEGNTAIVIEEPTDG